MNSLLSKVVAGIFLLTVQIISADDFGANSSINPKTTAIEPSTQSYHSSPIDSAYFLYLTGLYEESYTIYKKIFESESSQNAQYGMINCLVALGRTDEALLISRSGNDPILRAKEAWILGIQNNRNAIENIKKRSEEQFSQIQNAVILRSAGDGFYSAGKYRSALSMYQTAQSLVFDSLTESAINTSKIAKRSAILWTGSVLGGPIIYSSNSIIGDGDAYRYTKGSFVDFSSRWDIRTKTAIEIGYNRFDASFGENRFGINRLYTSLDNTQRFPWPTNYNLHDSLSNWTSDPDGLSWYNVGNVLDTSYLNWAIDDTTWLLYKDISLLDVSSDVFDTVVRFTPESIYQNTFFTGISLLDRGYHHRTINLAGSFFRSNMNNMTQGTSIHFSLGRNLNHISVVGHGYSTITESFGVFQLSPELAITAQKFTGKLTPSYIAKLKSPNMNGIPQNQFSLETELGIKGTHSEIRTTFTVGKRALAGESSGKNLVTIVLPHRFSGSFYGAILPGTGRFSIFTLMRFENYEQLSRLIALGGVTITL